MPAPAALPVVIEPFSTFGDEVAGNTADEIAVNLLGATRTSLSWRCQLRRPCPDLYALFAGHHLSHTAKEALREVHGIYAGLAPRQQTPLAPRVLPVPTVDGPEQISLL